MTNIYISGYLCLIADSVTLGCLILACIILDYLLHKYLKLEGVIFEYLVLDFLIFLISLFNALCGIFIVEFLKVKKKLH